MRIFDGEKCPPFYSRQNSTNFEKLCFRPCFDAKIRFDHFRVKLPEPNDEDLNILTDFWYKVRDKILIEFCLFLDKIDFCPELQFGQF